jgi:hypothetical protein
LGVLLDQNIQNNEQIKDLISSIFDKAILDQSLEIKIIELKEKILSLVNDRTEIDIVMSNTVISNKSDIFKIENTENLFPIYTIPAGNFGRYIYAKKIATGDLKSPKSSNILNSKYFDLYLIKEMRTPCDLIATQLSLILYGKVYEMKITPPRKKSIYDSFGGHIGYTIRSDIVIKLIPNTIKSLSASELSINSSNSESIVKTLLVRCILGDFDEKLDNTVKTNNGKLIPIDFGVFDEYSAPRTDTYLITERYRLLLNFIRLGSKDECKKLIKNLNLSLERNLGMVIYEKENNLKVSEDELMKIIESMFTSENIKEVDEVIEYTKNDKEINDKCYDYMDNVKKMIDNIKSIYNLLQEKKMQEIPIANNIPLKVLHDMTLREARTCFVS